MEFDLWRIGEWRNSNMAYAVMLQNTVFHKYNYLSY